MYCGQCGTPNQDEAGHCETCGAPLLITTGARTCATCGGALGDNDRFCSSCGAQANFAEATGSYDATDDFGELDIDDIQLDELPDWLQEMAPASSPQPQEPPEATPQPSTDQPSPDDLPDWLRDAPSTGASSRTTPPPPPAPQPRGRDHQPANEFSLVTDEDLPDWLKALSDDEPDDTPAAAPAQQTSQPASFSTESQQTTAVANLYEVPAVSRAWLTQGRAVEPDQKMAAREEFSPLESMSGVATEQAGRQSIWDSGPIDTTPEDEQTRPFAISEEGGSGRGKLIVRLVILVLLVIVALILAFVLVQGV